ncbi:malate synthase [Sarracenia purpurea var. burkii]
MEKLRTAAYPATKIGRGYDVPDSVDVRGRYDPQFAKILTKDALRKPYRLLIPSRNPRLSTMMNTWIDDDKP